MKTMIIIIMGPPGSGKGTQCSILLNKYGMKHISTGDIIRKNISEQTELGIISKGYIDDGHLVPDELIVNLVEDTLSSMDLSKEKLLLDGYPRTIYQAQCLDKYLKSKNLKIDLAINLDVNDYTIISRAVSRRTCSNERCKQIYNLLEKPPINHERCDKCGAELVKRKDDTEDIVKERLSVYHTQTEPIVNYYKQQEKLFVVKGDLTIEEVTNRIEKELLETCKN